MSDAPRSDAFRPRRSVLYMPGANERALEKAATLDADALILDLEDSVAPDAKTAAREQVCAAVRSGVYGHREVIVRVNALGTPWHADDLAAAAAAGPDAVLVPKVESADQVVELVGALELGGAAESTALWAMIETPRAVLDAPAIAAAHERLRVLVLGTNDLVNETHGRHVPGRAPLLPALSAVLLAARAAGIAVLDGVDNDVGDTEGFAAEAEQGRDLGFDGKTLIHPRQIEPANAAFGPSADDIEQAEGLIAAFTEAESESRGVATYQGRMIESLHVRDARRILALAEAIAARP